MDSDSGVTFPRAIYRGGSYPHCETHRCLKAEDWPALEADGWRLSNVAPDPVIEEKAPSRGRRKT